MDAGWAAQGQLEGRRNGGAGEGYSFYWMILLPGTGEVDSRARLKHLPGQDKDKAPMEVSAPTLTGSNRTGGARPLMIHTNPSSINPSFRILFRE